MLGVHSVLGKDADSELLPGMVESADSGVGRAEVLTCLPSAR